MSRRPRNAVQYSFEGGEADPQFQRRADADLWLVTAERLRNVRLTNGGGFKRRPGLARVAAIAGETRFFEFTGRAGATRMLGFRNAALDVFTAARALEATVTSGAVWATADLRTLQYAAENDKIIVTHRSFAPRVLTWSGSAFSIAALAFATHYDGSSGQPYWRYQETKGITLTPSALTGSITLEATGGNPFVAAHVGVRFRILGREVEITAVTDGNTATATVITPLYPTRRLEVAASGAFAAGDQVRSSVDDIEMEVAAVVDSTHLDVILTDGFTDPGVTDNKLIGPNGTTTIAAVASATPLGTTQWDEALISPARGYPGGCRFHKGRLVLCDFPAAPEIHALSVLREPTDFDTGDAEDDDAVIDGPGDSLGRRVRWVVSSEQLLSLGEAGSYYVGEGPNTPVTPTTVEFLRIGPEPAGDCNPVLAAEGVVFAETQGDRLMLLAPSGQLRRVWGATEMLSTASELLNSPKRLLLVDGCDWGPERYLLCINDDGSLCAVHYRRDADVPGPTLWTTEGGEFVDVGLFGREVWACVKRGSAYTIEVFDPDRLLDNSVVFSHTSGAPTNAALANRTVALVWRTTAGGEQRRADIGLFAGNGSGALTTAPTSARTYEAGNRFPVLARLWPPIDPAAGPSTWQRVASASIDVLRSGMFYAMGKRFSAYRASSDISQPPPLRTGWRKRRFLGRERDFSFEVTQVEAAPLEVRCIVLEAR